MQRKHEHAIEWDSDAVPDVTTGAGSDSDLWLEVESVDLEGIDRGLLGGGSEPEDIPVVPLAHDDLAVHDPNFQDETMAESESQSSRDLDSLPHHGDAGGPDLNFDSGYGTTVEYHPHLTG